MQLCISRPGRSVCSVVIRPFADFFCLEIAVERDTERAVVVTRGMIAVTVPAAEGVDTAVGRDYAVITGQPFAPVAFAILNHAHHVLELAVQVHGGVMVNDLLGWSAAPMRCLEFLHIYAAGVRDFCPCCWWRDDHYT